MQLENISLDQRNVPELNFLLNLINVNLDIYYSIFYDEFIINMNFIRKIIKLSLKI